MRISFCRPFIMDSVSVDTSRIKEALLSLIEKVIETELKRRVEESVSKQFLKTISLKERFPALLCCRFESFYEFGNEKYDDIYEAGESSLFCNIPYLDLWKKWEDVKKLLKFYRRQIRKRISWQLHILLLLRMKNSGRSTTPQISDKMILTIPTPPTMNIVTYGIPMWGMAYGKVL